MDHTGSQDLRYPKSVDHWKKTKPSFNCSQNARILQPSAPIADFDPWRRSSSRFSSPAVFSTCPIQYFATLVTPSNHLLDAPVIFYTQIAAPLKPLSYSNGPATSHPSWERLTSNPSQAVTCSSIPSKTLKRGKCISKLQSMSSTTSSTKSERSDELDFIDSDIDNERHLLLDDANDFDCVGNGCKRLADCIHTSEIIDSGGDTMVPDTISDISLFKAKEARLKFEVLLIDTAYVGNKTMIVDGAMDSLLQREINKGDNHWK
ncbi:Peroxisomal acyl-coenzyme A oxidase 1 [Venturia nashicola]|uniref:Peroxisomal acyl-coenzyme A oxidase 1 n=1 Tax=Venturia nashicola TaxID=86259 RepID=A0A4Z1P2D8_9PEZI|nr:Peroxisomal acyl-coenzyme A oxidase 1 [Venturia nashicola]TLD20792.1 Peroxisomal acyl-coenzyme A oxidase 1 [Venturia nashicola]